VRTLTAEQGNKVLRDLITNGPDYFIAQFNAAAI